MMMMFFLQENNVRRVSTQQHISSALPLFVSCVIFRVYHRLMKETCVRFTSNKHSLLYSMSRIITHVNGHVCGVMCVLDLTALFLYLTVTAGGISSLLIIGLFVVQSL